jgi:hypothetical protein
VTATAQCAATYRRVANHPAFSSIADQAVTAY